MYISEYNSERRNEVEALFYFDLEKYELNANVM